MLKLIARYDRALLTTSVCGLLLNLPIPATAQPSPAPLNREPVNREPVNGTADFIRLVVRANDDPSSLNQERLEDLENFNRLSTLAKQIKPYCSSLLADEFSLPEVPVIERLPPGLIPLWIHAAGRPEAELQLKAAEAIARASVFQGADLDDTPPLLLKLLDAKETQHAVRLAAARALLALNQREAAPVLRKHAAAGLEFAQLIEPALADWNDGPMRSVWLSRLDADAASPGMLILAIQAAAKTELKAAVPQLHARVLDWRMAPHVRLEAAKAIGQLADEPFISDARQLMTANASGQAVLDHLLAAYLLCGQVGEEGLPLLQQLALDSEPAVATVAFRRLLEIEPTLTRSAMDHAMASPDPGLRQAAAEALFRLQTPADVRRLSGLLSDPNVSVRLAAQQWLIRSDAIEELSSTARLSALEVLNADLPRGIAQAAIVVGKLNHKPAADRLVELLNHDAPDVSIAVAWALRRLAVPGTAEPILRHLTAQTEHSLIEIPLDTAESLDWIWDMYEQHKHLIETLGILRFGPAESLLGTFIPVPLGKPLNHPFHWIHCTRRTELRARAIWALGGVHHDQSTDDLVPLLTARLEDQDEPVYVAAMAALSLGQMKISGVVPTLEKLYAPGVRYTESFPRPSILAQASRKALESITGESLPPIGVDPFEVNKTAWFLEPL